MLQPKDFKPEIDFIPWLTILGVFAVQMAVLIAISIAVANHSSFPTATLPAFEAIHR